MQPTIPEPSDPVVRPSRRRFGWALSWFVLIAGVTLAVLTAAMLARAPGPTGDAFAPGAGACSAYLGSDDSTYGDCATPSLSPGAPATSQPLTPPAGPTATPAQGSYCIDRSVPIQQGQTVTNTVTVSTGCPNLTVSIEWAHGGGTSTVSTTLMSPTGQAITAATQAADVEHDSDPTWESYDISFPETGVWTIISTGVSVEPGGGTVGVNAEALPPIAPAVLAFATPSSGNPPLTVTFTAAAALEGGTITSYVWNFGDGTAGSGATATHRYTADGTYVATLTVTSSEGERASSTTSQIVVG